MVRVGLRAVPHDFGGPLHSGRFLGFEALAVVALGIAVALAVASVVSLPHAVATYALAEVAGADTYHQIHRNCQMALRSRSRYLGVGLALALAPAAAGLVYR